MLSLRQELGWIWMTENICSSPPEIKHSQDKRRQQNAFILSNDTLTGVQLLNCCVCTNLAYRVILASTPGNVLSSSMYSVSFSSQQVLVQSLQQEADQIYFNAMAWVFNLLQWWLGVTEVIISQFLFYTKQWGHHPAKDHWILVKETFEEAEWCGIELWLLMQVKSAGIALSILTQIWFSSYCLYPNLFRVCILKGIMITLIVFSIALFTSIDSNTCKWNLMAQYFRQNFKRVSEYMQPITTA